MQQEPLLDALVQQLVDVIEPYTRFDRSSVSIVESQTTSCQIMVTDAHTVSFAIATSSGSGALPSGTRKLGSSAALEEHTARLMASSREKLETKLRNWAESQRELPGTALSADSCHDGTQAGGYEYKCKPCAGRGETDCTRCRGGGSDTCNFCYGSGKSKCGNCQGQGNVACSRCHGTGSVDSTQSRQRTNAASGQSWTEHYVESSSCPACQGRRQQRCESFGCQSGQVSCSHCRATGKISCGGCNGSGHVACSTCNRTGTLHERGDLACSVEHSFKLEADASNEEARSKIESLGSLANVCALARMELLGTDVRERSLRRKIGGRMSLTAARVRAAGTEADILGYGDRAQVFDFKGIVAKLLAADLEGLETAVSRSPWLSWRPAPELDEALRTFLSSEVNAKIGRISGSKDSSYQELARGDLRGAVSPEYVARTAKAMRAAVLRLYRGAMLLPAAIAATLPGIAILVVPLLNRSWRGEETGWSVLAVAVIGLIGADFWAMARLKARFEPELAPKAAGVVSSTWTRWRWPPITLLGMIAVLFAVALAASSVGG